MYPQSVIDWDYEKNELEPSEVFPHSNKKYWFICTKGHSYDMVMHHKIKGANCPICSNQRLLSGYNDLKTTHPDIAMEWDYDKNEINPDKVFSGSHKKVWWKCKKGHTYLSSIASRTGLNTGCPYCANQKVIIGENDLLTVNPNLAVEWDYEKNLLKPSEVFPNSNKKAYWICTNGHSFLSTISDRNSGKGCPICSNKVIIKGINDLGTTHPKLLLEWDYDKNVIHPTNISFGSRQKVWWRCSKNHSWQAVIYSRAKENGNGCPICAKGLQSSLPEKVISYY